MNRLLLLLLVAGVTFLIILFAVNPDLADSIWLWIVGLIGAIIKFFQMAFGYIKDKFSGETDKQGKESENGKEDDTAEKEFHGLKMHLLRLSDDGITTIGLLFINHKFYCYTLEDTFRKVKITRKTRIPAGSYDIKFRKEETRLTTVFRERHPEWFTWHLELQDINDFQSVYIHNGGNHRDSDGCILVSDSLNLSSQNKILTNSSETFRRFYHFLSEKLEHNIPIRIIIKDENWIKNLK